jgi:hemoglobin-like flavoprotein
VPAPEADVTPEQIRLVQNSFDRAFSAFPQLTELFYAELFKIAPHVRPMFPDDLAPLRRKFVDMLVSIVGLLDRPDMFSSLVEALGKRHARYGVKPEHFTPVGIALISALRTALGERFDEVTAAAWGTLFVEVRRVMERGMAKAG